MSILHYSQPIVSFFDQSTLIVRGEVKKCIKYVKATCMVQNPVAECAALIGKTNQEKSESGGIGRRAGFRFQCPRRESSSLSSRTIFKVHSDLPTPLANESCFDQHRGFIHASFC